MALAPHWMDEVFTNVRDKDDLLPLLLNSPEMQAIASKAFEAGEKQRRDYIRNPNVIGPSIAQSVRAEFLRRLEASSREEAIA